MLLGIRNEIKADIGSTAAELVYGCTLKLPSDLVEVQLPISQGAVTDFATTLKHRMQLIQFTKTSNHAEHHVYVPKNLETAKFVFIRVESVKKPLQAPCNGPYQVL